MQPHVTERGDDAREIGVDAARTAQRIAVKYDRFRASEHFEHIARTDEDAAAREAELGTCGGGRSCEEIGAGTERDDGGHSAYQISRSPVDEHGKAQKGGNARQEFFVFRWFIQHGKTSLE